MRARKWVSPCQRTPQTPEGESSVETSDGLARALQRTARCQNADWAVHMALLFWRACVHNFREGVRLFFEICLFFSQAHKFQISIIKFLFVLRRTELSGNEHRDGLAFCTTGLQWTKCMRDVGELTTKANQTCTAISFAPARCSTPQFRWDPAWCGTSA